MAMPTGDSPQKAQAFYHYLLAHHETEHRVKTWSVDWLSLAWLWGFVVALSLILLWWVWQYRTTRHKMGVYPVDSWSGFTTELAPRSPEELSSAPCGAQSCSSPASC